MTFPGKCRRSIPPVCIILLHASLAFGQGIVSTIAGTEWIFPGHGKPGLDAPLGLLMGITRAADGSLLAADQDNNLVVRLSTSGILTVSAGNGIRGFSGDGGPAVNASLNLPVRVAVDSAGNIFIADSQNHRIRKVDAQGVITTVAGNGTRGFSGDGGLATQAALNLPDGVAVDATGNIYISDTLNQRVRKISPNGVINTIAGTGAFGFGGDGGPAVNAVFRNPRDLNFDGVGNLYIGDPGNHRIRLIDPSGTIRTVAGNGETGDSGDGGPAANASLNGTRGAVVDPTTGSLYIIDSFNSRIRKVSPAGIITTVAGTGTADFSGDGGAATAAALNSPRAVTLDPAGNLYIADSLNQRIRKVDTAGVITTIAGNQRFKFSGDGPARLTTLSTPEGVAVDLSGNLYIVDMNNSRIRKVDGTGRMSTIAGDGTFRYSGDGGPAAQASLKFPRRLTLQTGGNIFFSDTTNNRIRKITPGGIISTVAGDGGQAFAGDGGPAVAASLNRPRGLAIDAAGNLFFADKFNNRIRRVNTAGVIATVAGNGPPAYSGDGGPAVSASLNSPEAVALDAQGNLYIADSENHRVRKVDPGGTITTFAGNGTAAFSGDGGPAALASVIAPADLAFDRDGTLYIADRAGARIRKVDTNGIITTVAGDGAQGFSGDGGPPLSASFNAPHGVAVDADGNIFIADTLNDRIRKIQTAPPSYSATPASLSFSAAAGALQVPAQQVDISSSVTGLGWSTQASTESGGNWLTASPSSGSAPGTADVSVSVASLAPGSYQGTVTVRTPFAALPARTVSVALTVTEGRPRRLVAEPAALSFAGIATAGNPPAQTLQISNAGSGALSWSAQPATVSGGNWLTVSPSSGSASDATPAAVQVSANLAGLAPGVYSGSIRLQSSGLDPQTVAVTLLVSPVTQTILVSQTALLYTGVQGGSIVPSQTFGILNTEQGAMSWTVEASTLSGGSWLSVSPANGSSRAGSLEVPLVEVGVNTSGLSEGQYSGQVLVSAPGANNSPQFVTVTLDVLPAGSTPPPVVRPTGLIFVRQEGTSSPGSQTVRLETAAPSGLEAVINPFTFQGGDWLDAVPGNLAVSPNDRKTLVVQPTLGELAAGQYFGFVPLGFSDGSSQTVKVLFVVTRPGTSPAGLRPSRGDGRADLDGCVPQQLFSAARSLGGNFSSPVSWPSLIEVQVKDDCDNLVSNAAVAAGFSNGDPPLILTPVGQGLYQGTWSSTQAGSVRVSVRAERPGLTPTEIRLDGRVTGNIAAPPVVSLGGVVNGASFGAGEPVSPGSIISVFGRNLAQGLNPATRLPLEKSLGGATLSIGGIEAPLFFAADGQINAQVPFELPPNSRPQVVVRTQRVGGATQDISIPQTITVAETRPGIFTVNVPTERQGAILLANSDVLAAPEGSIPGRTTRPAARGGFISIFCTGLGATEPAVPSGELSPAAEPLARVRVPVEAQIGGQPAAVHFAGLAPGFVALYQVNVEIPASVETGAEVPVLLLQNGVPSNTVTIAVQ